MNVMRHLRGRLHSTPCQLDLPTSAAAARCKGSWETTRSCPGSLRLARRHLSPSPHSPDAAAGNTSSPGRVAAKAAVSKSRHHKRHRSDPGSSVAQLTEVVGTRGDEPYSVGNSTAGSHWSLCMPVSVQGDDVFEGGGARDFYYDTEHFDDEQEQQNNSISLKNVLSVRSHGMLSIAFLCSAGYLVYALYVSITRVRFCKAQPIIITSEQT